ncbi:MAG: phosphoribosyltransferase family protein [Marinobacter sp.]|uniref:phosphoribosyltransferase n=1 Tax=Marinobacter sp. TaxID=50741 RepID=UPI00299E5FF7|nr:phosphoribosyltransferase family protein [Marinobacter sp.]MDX1755239.1 phosphoribosyltransferase family protein [Marinobacter sp.]
MSRVFQNRQDAGEQLAERLAETKVDADALVLGLPRGGLPIAEVVARKLGLKLEAFNVRKLGVPYQPELAMGAIAEDGTRFLNRRLIQMLELTEQDIRRVQDREEDTLAERSLRYRAGRPKPQIADRPIILVDDGLATGATMHAALNAIRHQHPERVTVAVPVAARDTADEFRRLADEFVCVLEPEDLGGVGCWYADFSQVSDQEVCDILAAMA